MWINRTLIDKNLTRWI